VTGWVTTGAELAVDAGLASMGVRRVEREDGAGNDTGRHR